MVIIQLLNKPAARVVRCVYFGNRLPDFAPQKWRTYLIDVSGGLQFSYRRLFGRTDK